MVSPKLLKKDSRIAIINRGEPAVRFINAVSDFNFERGTSLMTIAMYTIPDQHAKFVQRADESILLGDALEPDYSQLDDSGEPVRKSPYLNYARLRQALEEMRADGVWVGWGFVAEHAEFADMCDEMGIAFIGPSGDTMRMLGDKIGSKQLSEKAGVAVSPWSKGAVDTVAEAVKWGAKIGYPLVIKATAGGGGRGIRKVFSEDQVEAAFNSASSEALKAFGDGTVFMEKMMVDCRHLEVQVIADNKGTAWAVGVRDCSVQRRHQKVIEEGPAIILTPAKNKMIKEAACQIAAASNYKNAGTAEFLYTPENGKFYFMEMNTRLQVEHPVTEVTTGADMVKLQIRMAMGETLKGSPPKTHGHAIEVRLNAEDPYNGFAPSPGRIKAFNIPGGPGIRVDSGVAADSEISSAFDSMVAKIISYGSDREEALARLRRVIKASTIVIENGTTNKSFLLELLRHKTFIKNNATTGWLDAMMEEGLSISDEGAAAALIAGCVEIYGHQLHEERASFFKTVSRGRPRKLPVSPACDVEIKLNGSKYAFEIRLLEPEYYQIFHEGKHFDVRLIRDSPSRARLYYNQRKYNCIITERQKDIQVEVDGSTYLVEQDSGGMVRSQSPAVILAVHVEPGQKIQEGDPLVTLEAMKMEMHLHAPSSGQVGEIFVKKNVQVAAGDPILVVEESSDEGEDLVDQTSVSASVSFEYGSKPQGEVDPAHQVLREAQMFMMGYDVHRSSFENLCDRLPDAIKTIADQEGGDEELILFLQHLFELYFHIEFLFLKEFPGSELQVGSPEQNFFTYLQLLGSGKEHPNEDFTEHLEKALAHYDVTPDQAQEDLEEAVIRLFYSHDNAKLKRSLIRYVEDAYRQCEIFGDHGALKNLLHEIITQARGFGGDIHTIATDFYYEVVAKAGFDSKLDELRETVDSLLAQLRETKDLAEAQPLMDEIVKCPKPLVPYLMGKMEDIDLTTRFYFSRILSRRVHFEQELSQFETEEKSGIVRCSSVQQIDRSTTMILTFVAPLERLKKTLEQAQQRLRGNMDHDEIHMDIMLYSNEATHRDEIVATITEKMAEFPRFPHLAKIQFVVWDPTPILGCYLFKPGKNGYEEQRLTRDILEVQAERFAMERLQGFHTRRLPTSENIHLFHCTAKENEEDQRLISFIEIRTAPEEQEEPFHHHVLHRDLLMTRKAMTDWMSGRARSNFYWNQIIIYIRPLLHVSQEAFLTFLREELTGYGDAGLEKVRVYALLARPNGDIANIQVEVDFPGGMGIKFRINAPLAPKIPPLSQQDFKKALARRRNINYPYEVIRLLTDGYFFKGEFDEYELVPGKDGAYTSKSVKGRPDGQNWHGMVYGIITNFTPAHPEGMRRVLLLSDGNYGLGCLAEHECRYAIAALELARKHKLPLEWFPISSGAKISMDNGTENLDWTARVLRDIIEFTQDGGEINIVVDAINVGAQSYWNAEATMLMHNKGCLIMTPRGCMVLTGKGALDYAGAVSADDNLGIGGLNRIMGPNAQVQYPANDLLHACETLFRYYALTYVAPGEAKPRPYPVNDPEDRNICEEPYSFNLTPDFTRIGDLFDDSTNPGKKKPFDMRKLMAAVADKDTVPLERWPSQLDAETAIIWDTTLGGECCSLIGIQSMPIKRQSEIPNDGPDSWSGGTLFPQSSKKLARALNAASGRRPVVIMANLSGFDGSPESLRRWQLEYGAEIGRAVVLGS